MSNMQHVPGTVAMATVRGVPNVRVMRCASELWVSAEYVKQNCDLHRDDEVTNIRPLVVLDPEDREQMRRVAECAADGDAAEWRVNMWQRYFRSLAKPPKPEEPGAAGSLVEDCDGVLWAKTVWGLWTDLNYMSRDRKWCDINAVKVIRS